MQAHWRRRYWPWPRAANMHGIQAPGPGINEPSVGPASPSGVSGATEGRIGGRRVLVHGMIADYHCAGCRCDEADRIPGGLPDFDG